MKKRRRRYIDLYSGTGTIAQILSPAAKTCDRSGNRGGSRRSCERKMHSYQSDWRTVNLLPVMYLKVLDSQSKKSQILLCWIHHGEGIHPKALEKIIRLWCGSY